MKQNNTLAFCFCEGHDVIRTAAFAKGRDFIRSTCSLRKGMILVDGGLFAKGHDFSRAVKRPS